jgi:hypothetical protein
MRGIIENLKFKIFASNLFTRDEIQGHHTFKYSLTALSVINTP